MTKVEGKVRAGVIGTGSIAEIAHFPSIQSLPQVDLVALADVVEDKVKAAAAKWGAEVWYTDYQDMLKRDDLDVIVIATPNAQHYEQGMATINAGIHLIIEKPLAVTNGQGWRLVEAAKEAGVRLMTGTNQRFWLPNEIGKSLIDAGLIGDVKMGRTSLHEGYGLYHSMISHTPFRSDPELAGAGSMFDLGAHRVDLLVWFMGSKPKRMTSCVKRLAAPESYTTLDDAYVTLIEFENGNIGFVTGDRFSPIVSNIQELYATEGQMFVSTEATNPFQSAPLAFFTNKDYTWDELPEIVQKYRYPINFWAEDLAGDHVLKRWVTITPPREWSYTRMWDHFADCILTGKEPMMKAEDGAIVMDILCGAFKAWEEGVWLDLPLKEEVVPPMYKPYYKGL